MKTKHGTIRLFSTALLVCLLPIPTFSQKPPSLISSGCDQYGQILNFDSKHNKSFRECSDDSTSPDIQAQIKRLNELVADDVRNQHALAEFVSQINSTATLVKGRNEQLTRSVSQFIRSLAQHTDTKAIQEITTLTDKMGQLETRLDALQRDPTTAPKVRQAIASGVGDDLANLHPDKASQVLEAIGLLDKKLDSLAVRINCSSATPEALAVAIRAHAADRTLDLVHCRPENLITPDVQTAFVMLFTSNNFPASKPFLDALIRAGFNPLKEIKPLNGPVLDPSNPSGPLRARYFYAPVYRPLMDGNVDALKWIISNTPPGYWDTYPKLMEDITKIMRLPWAPISGATAAQAISLLRKAGVSVDRDDYKAFRDAYEKWLATELPGDLSSPISPPTQIQRIMMRQMGFSSHPIPQQPHERDLWKQVSDALAPTSLADLRKARSEAVAEITESDFEQANKVIQQVSDQLTRTKWWRKLPETQANLDEAARRQAVNVFDNFGYVPVAAADLRDDDVARNQYYPNCNCITVRDLRDRIAKATKQRESILRFRSMYSN